jgi:rhodanese-related sulfurtransferase
MRKLTVISLAAVLALMLPAAYAVTKDTTKETPKAEEPKKDAAKGNDYPHRSSFPDVQIISTADLTKQIDKVVVVDVRTKYEYDTLHVKGSVNIPVTGKDFMEKAKKLYDESGKPLVFYCNGKTCKKSYDAARLANRAKVDRNYCFDAGIFEWAKANPERTALLGRSPIRVEELIDKDKIKKHTLGAKEFEAKIGPSAIVLDIRDLAQRDIALFPFKEERVPLDQKARIDDVIARAKAQRKTLLVYDKVGHQVQWFQYYLEDRGLRDYYFMKGGAEGYYEVTLGVTMGLKKK